MILSINFNLITCSAMSGSEAETKAPLYALRGILLNLVELINDPSFVFKADSPLYVIGWNCDHVIDDDV